MQLPGSTLSGLETGPHERKARWGRRVFLGLLLIPITLLTIVTYELFARVTVDPISHRVRIADEDRRESEEDGR